MTITLSDVSEYVEQTYNHSITIYNCGSHVRVTNGSAAMYGDICIEGDTLKIKAERYGEQHQDTYKATTDGLKTALSDTLGL
jgi:uncharacterized heparinase superfamily protein